MKINWAGPLTKGRQVYASCADGRGGFYNVNFTGGFLIGWDRWSDGRFGLSRSTHIGGSGVSTGDGDGIVT